MNGFPTRATIKLEKRPREQQWLVDTRWGDHRKELLHDGRWGVLLCELPVVIRCTPGHTQRRRSELGVSHQVGKRRRKTQVHTRVTECDSDTFCV